MKISPGHIGQQAGVTLAELMIAVALIGVGILALMGSFNVVHQAIQSSKTGTLASNLAQEKMQIIMQQPYYQILVTTNPINDTDFTPNLVYDTGFFPPESVLQGGVWFTRMTYVQVVQEVNGSIQTLPPTTPDTGMRQITVNVIWQSNTGKHSLTVQNVINNPNTVMSNAAVQGTVTDATTGAHIQSALVDVAENIGWRENTDATGHYTLNMSPGNFHVAASALGYFPINYYLAIAPNSPAVTQNFALTPISSGTINGTAWLNNHLVISQVVSSTGPANNIEYVELYNPTTAAFTLGSNASPTTPNIWTVVFDAAGNVQAEQLVYVNTSIPSYGYFLISNTGDGGGFGTTCSSFTISGITINPDACWRFIGGTAPNFNHALQCNPIAGAGCATAQNASGIGIGTNGGLPWTGLGNATPYDSIAWTGNGVTPPYYETTPATPSSATGMLAGEAFVRHVDTTTTISVNNGNAYDSNNNSVDFIDYVSLPFPPRTTANVYVPTTGTPVVGANVSVTDGMSASVKALLTGNPPYAQFIVPGVATGTWTTFIDSGTNSAEIDNISVVANTTTSLNSVILSTQGVTGIISGNITDILSNPPSLWVPSGVNVSIAGQIYPVNATTGHYSVRLPTGTYNVTANPNLGNAAYETQTQPSIPVTLGDETADISFQLAEGGKISGWVTRDGINPLPGVSVVALDSNGDAHDTEVSANNGSFTLINLTTGVYTIEPSIDSSEGSSPTSSTATVVPGTNVLVGTFTVTGAMGSVTGTVTAGGSSIQSGVLVLISTATIALPPPAISSNTLTGAVYYDASSLEDGTYSVQVRGSTSTVYNVVGLYMHMNGQTPVISSQTIHNVTVTAGQPITENFAW